MPCCLVFMYCLAFLFLSASAAAAESGPKLLKPKYPRGTSLGIVEGQLWEFDGVQGAIFRGIPYAQPPVGELRFSKPEPVTSWEPYKFEAKNHKPACIQFAAAQVQEARSKDMEHPSEDCLYLNIFAPPEGENHAVIVWIHGGSFISGSGLAGIDEETVVKHFCGNDVILVTINYRLGIYGFAAGPTPEDGNYGLWDQIMAIDWVYDNIEKFGGDKYRITVMGASAGAASASILALSPAADHINKAILLSGSIASYWATDEHKHHKFAFDKLNDYMSCRLSVSGPDPVGDDDLCRYIPRDYDMYCDAGVSEDTWQCFREKSQHLSEKALTKFRETLSMTELGMLKPVTGGSLIPYNATEMLNTFPKIPILLGVTEDEWNQRRMKVERSGYRTSYDEESRINYLQEVIKQKYPESDTEKAAIAAHYQYVEQLQNGTQENFDTNEMADFMRKTEGDIQFVAPVVREANAYAAKGNDVFLYSFNHVPVRGIVRMEFGKPVFGVDPPIMRTIKPNIRAFHGLDLAYLLTKGEGQNFEFQYERMDEEVSNDFAKFITNFAKEGTPTPHKGGTNVEWKTYTEAEPNFMNIESPPRPQKGNFFWSATSFWNRYMPKLMRSSDKEQSQARQYEGSEASPLKNEERAELAAYKQSWLALWILVGVIIAILWIVIIILVVRRCMTTKTDTRRTMTVYRGP